MFFLFAIKLFIIKKLYYFFSKLYNSIPVNTANIGNPITIFICNIPIIIFIGILQIYFAIILFFIFLSQKIDLLIFYIFIAYILLVA